MSENSTSPPYKKIAQRELGESPKHGGFMHIHSGPIGESQALQPHLLAPTEALKVVESMVNIGKIQILNLPPDNGSGNPLINPIA